MSNQVVRETVGVTRLIWCWRYLPQKPPRGTRSGRSELSKRVRRRLPRHSRVFSELDAWKRRVVEALLPLASPAPDVEDWSAPAVVIMMGGSRPRPAWRAPGRAHCRPARSPREPRWKFLSWRRVGTKTMARRPCRPGYRIRRGNCPGPCATPGCSATCRSGRERPDHRP